MTDKEKIRAEIESRLKRLTDGCVGQRYAYRTLLEFIDSLYEEPVSEDLEEAAEGCLPYPCPMWYAGDDDGYEEAEKEINKRRECFKLGAKWQKQQILDCNTTLQRTFELGKQEMKQQLLAKAVDIEVKVDAGGYPYIPQMELYDYDKDVPLAKEGDKYKVILIKE